MRSSRYTISTLKETPADADIVSHQLMVRAGMIRKLASGLYSWMPIGLRVLRKVEAIVREEMDRAGAQELLMPAVQPAELWRESGRWEKYEQGLLLKLHDRHQRDFCFGPTHEEVITDIARNELHSHKQLPVNYYQIQIKFRDEIRPRFGVMRAREFLMKDAYSFHLSQECLQETYEAMYVTYTNIFSRMGLDFRAVQADSGDIGGSQSMEFQVLAASGEDEIVISSESQYAANMEMARSIAEVRDTSISLIDRTTVDTPGTRTIEEVCAFLKVAPRDTAKTLIVRGEEQPLVALVLRGDHELNALKAEKLPGVASPLTMATDEEITAQLHCEPGFLGPVALGIPCIVDHAAAALTNFVCGANERDKHHAAVNWERDATLTTVADLRKVKEGDPSPDGKGVLSITRGIEVGQIFQLGTIYTSAMNATVLDEEGKAVSPTMGCYGIGISRTVAAVIEQCHDDSGIIWPDAIAPFNVIIVPINAHRSEQVKSAAEHLYQQLLEQDIDVLLDDRADQRPGAKFADAELIGIPHRIVVGERGLKEGKLEYGCRADGTSQDVPLAEIIPFLIERIRG